jgi:hypothetical protein
MKELRTKKGNPPADKSLKGIYGRGVEPKHFCKNAKAQALTNKAGTGCTGKCAGGPE